MVLMWLGEQITARGVGNGVSLIIFAGIVARLPSAFGQLIEQSAFSPGHFGAHEHPAAVGSPALGQLRLADAVVALDQHQPSLACTPALHQLLRFGQAFEVLGFDKAFFHSTVLLACSFISQINSGTLCDGGNRHRALLKPGSIPASLSHPKPRDT